MIPEKLGDYEVLAPLGDGGMGVVFRARHVTLKREVALKILNAHAVMEPEGRVRFQREAVLAARLSHPNLITIMDGGEADGILYLAMELIDGETLHRMIRRVAPIPWAQALALVSRMAAGLAHLHSQDILHRDIKPPNVMVSREGYVKLLDFGLARAVDSTLLTQAGSLVGTVPYLAPEIITGFPASTGSDLWSIGCIFYQLLTGETHIPIEPVSELLRAISQAPIIPPSNRRPEIPDAVSRLALSLLSRPIAGRPPSAQHLQEMADTLLADLANSNWEQELTPGFLDRVSRCAPVPPSARTIGATEVTPHLRRVPTPRDPLSRVPTPQNLRRRVPSSAHRSSPMFRKWKQDWRIPAAAMLLVVAVFTGLSFRGGSGPGAAPSPGPIGGIPDSNRASVFRQWHDLVSYLPALAEGGVGARRAMTELKTRSGMDMGQTPESWIQWFRLGQWLADPHRGAPPHFADWGTDLMDPIEEKVAIGYLGDGSRPSGAPLLSALVKSVGSRPNDGRCWLALGRALEQDNLPAGAQVAYTRALSALTPPGMGDMPTFVWTGFARALTVVPGRSIEREWCDWLPFGRSRLNCWTGLREVIGLHNPDLFVRLLRKAQELPPQDEIASLCLGRFQLEIQGQVAPALTTWTEALRRHPKCTELLECLAEFHAFRGNTDDLRHILIAVREVKTNLSLEINFLLNEPTVQSPIKQDTFELVPPAELLEHDLYRLLELGLYADAAQRVTEYLQLYPARQGYLGLLAAELLANGATDPRYFPCARKLLIGRRAPPITWDRMAGILSTKAGMPYMEELLAQATDDSAPAYLVGLIRALWLSRAGEYARSLDLAGPQLQATSPPRSVVGLFGEILARPLLAKALGQPVPTAALERAQVMNLPSGIHQDVLLALRTEDFKNGALLASQAFDRNATQSYWALVRIQCAYRSGNPEWKEWARRLKVNARAHRNGLWLLRSLPR
jgi:serine/threonine protein kinase/tetratricopeptide (TPR) repeat protein